MANIQISRLPVIDRYIARLLMVSFFLPAKLQVLVTFGTCIYFVVRTITDKEYPRWQQFLQAAGLGAVYFLYLLALLFTPPAFSRFAHQYCEWRVSFLLLPLVIASLSPSKKQAIIRELPFFVYSCVVACLFANVAFVIHTLQSGGFKGVNHVVYRIYFEQASGLHPTYMSIYIGFSLCILLFHGRAMNRFLKFALFYILLFFLLLLFAKSPIIGLGVAALHYLWLRRATLRQYRWEGLSLVLLLVLSYVFVPIVSQRANEMLGLSAGAKLDNLGDNSVHERKMILSVDMSMLHDYWLTGCGPGRLLYLLKIRYFFYSLYYGRDVNSFDPHSEYMYEWVSFGIIGILVFVGGIVAHVYSAIRRRNWLYTYLMLIFVITFFTESVLARQQGIMFYSLFTSLFFFAGVGNAKPKGRVEPLYPL